MDEDGSGIGREAFDDVVHDILAQRGRVLAKVLRGLQQERLDLFTVIKAEEEVAAVLRASSIYRGEAEMNGKEIAEMRAAVDALTTVILDLERIAALDTSAEKQ